MERAEQEALARQKARVDELRKAELVRDRLEALAQIAGTFPDGHETQMRIKNLRLDRVLGTVEEDIRTLRDALIHPRGT